MRPIASGSLRVLDGGLATTLEARGWVLDDPLWSARVLVDRPEAIEQVHLDFLRAGAEVLIGASYQAAPSLLRAAGISERQVGAILARSVEVARRAARRFAAEGGRLAGEIAIAASVGPYGAALGDGSEYRGDYTVSRSALARFHQERIERLWEAGPDLLAIETCPRLDELEVLVELVARAGAKAWISVTTADGGRSLPSGPPLTEVAALAESSPHVVAVGVNCVRIECVEPALDALRSRTGKPLVAYPNSGEVFLPDERRWAGAPAIGRLVACVPRWIACGAALVGGCCRVGPDAIAAIAQRVRALRGRSDDEEERCSTTT